MAPQKIMAVSQQQQQQQQAQQQTVGRADQSSKFKRRRGKQQQQQQASANPVASQPHLNKQTATALERQQVPFGDESPNLNESKENLAEVPKSPARQPPSSVGVKGSPPNKKQTDHQPVPPVKVLKGAVPNSTTTADGRKKTGSIAASAATVTVQLAKQISTEEPDDIDAGIELDGSSNSGSSVKDLSEDQVKSTSVSPIMAQSNLINETCNSTKHAVEDAPLEQLTSSLCADIAPSSKKISSTTKQQLAANQQVIDADEQLLQQKLQSKQRKFSVQSNTSTGTNASNSSGGAGTNAKLGAAANNVHQHGAANVTVAALSPAMCKACGQHVYQMERMMAEKAVYHKSCFKCCQCKIQLRIDNFSSHEGQVYCKAHHRQIFQPQVKLDKEDDVDIVAKSTTKVVDDYLLHRGRLSDLSFSFLQPKSEGIRKNQMIICENEPAELPKDVVRSDTKIDDGIERLSLNLGNLKERFERAAATCNEGESQPSSANVVFDKPSYNLKKTLMAFETKSMSCSRDEEDGEKTKQQVERPVVKKLTNLNGFLSLSRKGSEESEPPTPTKPLAVRRSESLMMRLKKYESRIAGNQVVDDDEDDRDNDDNNGTSETGDENNNALENGRAKAEKGSSSSNRSNSIVPKKLASIDLSSLKNQWETGDISRRRFDDFEGDRQGANETNGKATSDNSPSTEKEEELIKIRQQLARRRSGGAANGGAPSSVKNIYENAIREAQQQQQRAQTSKLNLSDLSALNGFSTTEIQQQLLQNGSQNNKQQASNSTPSSSTPSKDHFQLNLTNKANKLRERFEQGLINNNASYEDSDGAEGDNEPTMTRLEQLRQEKLEDLSIFTEGEIRAREARSMFQQIDRRLSNGHQQNGPPNSRSLSSISTAMQAKLQAQMTPATKDPNTAQLDSNVGGGSVEGGSCKGNLANGQDKCLGGGNHLKREQQQQAGAEQQKPIRLVNNVRT